MNLKNIIQIWKAKGQILEGVKNSVFKKEHVEEIAEHRMSICHFCDLYTEDDKGCIMPGTSPCCNQDKGGCGCSLKLKTRSLSSDCPLGHWKAELTQEEEDVLNQKLNI
jgi:hypothetical protein